jgi:hypothetical protein
MRFGGEIADEPRPRPLPSAPQPRSALVAPDPDLAFHGGWEEMSAVAVYLMLYVPFAPPEDRTFLYRFPDAVYDTIEDCQNAAPDAVAAWLEDRERAGQGAIVVRNIICYRRGNRAA